MSAELEYRRWCAYPYLDEATASELASMEGDGDAVRMRFGSFMSFALPSRAYPFCAGNRVKGLSNVILATQWQQAPGGLPIAADVGKRAIKTITSLDRKKFIKD